MVEFGAPSDGRRWRGRVMVGVGWALASAVGAGLGMAARLQCGANGYHSSGWLVISLVNLALLATVLGLALWVVLRRAVRWAAWWVPATVVGVVGAVPVALIGGVVVMLVVVMVVSLVSLAVSGQGLEHGPFRDAWLPIAGCPTLGLGGLVVGVYQSFVLLGSTRRAFWWVPVSAVAGVAMLPVVFGVGLFCNHPITLENVASAALSGGSYGLVTGLVLVWILGGQPPRGFDAGVT